MTDAITPFRLEIPQDQLDDLADRLRRTRWVEPETVPDRSQGITSAYLRELVDHWQHRYDWRRCEARLNAVPQFTTEIDGLEIHFLHLRSPHPDAMPLLLTHGWPGSVVEFLDVIGPLVDPVSSGGSAVDAFDVVIPSLPGYGFSGKPTEAGWNPERIAAAWAELMRRLGYDRYAAQGGDWGSLATVSLAALDAEHVLGIHLNMPVVFPDPDDTPTEAERRATRDLKAFLRDGSGYQALQSTRPQTLGYGLVDSPVGQAAWIAEKFWEWTDHDGSLRLSHDQVLDAVMMYWLPATGASSARLYWEFARALSFPDVTVPVGITIFPKEIYRTSERWARKRFPGLRYWSEVERGGHFAAFEQPALFVDEVRACFREQRSRLAA